MKAKMRVMTPKPLNAETPPESLRSWITASEVFFDRNQGQIPEKQIDLKTWRLTVSGEVSHALSLKYEQILRMPREIVCNTLECSGNGRSLLGQKASGNPWTIGGVGNAVWGGVRLKRVLDMAGLKENARHVAFEGFDKPLGSAQIQFIRSIPIKKALDSTVLVYEMNGEPLPLKHGYPLRALALGWTGANCVKWLRQITIMEAPFEGFFMDKVYRIFQKGQDPRSGDMVSRMNLKSIITQPVMEERLAAGEITILGAAYAGEDRIERVEVSTDGGRSWENAAFIGPDLPHAWRQWQFIWEVSAKGFHTLMSRATDTEGRCQPMHAQWNALGYGNNGIQEHAVSVQVV